jgi:cyclic pyranopterin phosphate synthase
MKDNFDREISYLRVSVTDRCNLRCQYCMPACGVEKLKHDEILRSEEILEIVRAAAKIGMRKVRITGGEPLIRRDIVHLCAGIAGIDGIEALTMTTNGVLLREYAADLKRAGVSRVNVSLDTLNAAKYQQITRIGKLDAVLAGIEAAQRARLAPIKINTVLINGFNDDEIVDFAELTRSEAIEVRFIELMPIGEGTALWPNGYLSSEAVLRRVPELEPVQASDGVARLYRLRGGLGKVGLISPVSRHFCAACDRLRLTSTGMVKPCLHASHEIPLRGLHGQALTDALTAAVLSKPARHGGLSAERPSLAGRDMNGIGG